MSAKLLTVGAYLSVLVAGFVFHRKGKTSKAKSQQAHVEVKSTTASVPQCETKSSPPQTLLEYAVLILKTHHTDDKARLTFEAQSLWKADKLPLGDVETCELPPDRPARPLDLNVVEPKDMPKPQKGASKEIALANRIRLIHSQAHIESYAIDLAWDILCRYVRCGIPGDPTFRLPWEYFDDWLRVAVEEATHFSIWRDRLVELGSHYGALAVHDALWGSAYETRNNILERLAVVHMVHEARGLDQSPRMVSQLASGGDKKSAQLLEKIEKDEITHVGSGARWFKYICDTANPPLHQIETFHAIVNAKFRGSLRPPFATEMRAQAGMTPEWYLPMVHEEWRAHMHDEMSKYPLYEGVKDKKARQQQA